MALHLLIWWYIFAFIFKSISNIENILRYNMPKPYPKSFKYLYHNCSHECNSITILNLPRLAVYLHRQRVASTPSVDNNNYINRGYAYEAPCATSSECLPFSPYRSALFLASFSSVHMVKDRGAFRDMSSTSYIGEHKLVKSDTSSMWSLSTIRVCVFVDWIVICFFLTEWHCM